MRRATPKVKWTTKHDALLARLLQRWERRLCVLCDAPIASAEQVEDVMFALPCGHRIGLGDARAYNAGMKGVG